MTAPPPTARGEEPLKNRSGPDRLGKRVIERIDDGPDFLLDGRLPVYHMRMNETTENFARRLVLALGDSDDPA